MLRFMFFPQQPGRGLPSLGQALEPSVSVPGLLPSRAAFSIDWLAGSSWANPKRRQRPALNLKPWAAALRLSYLSAEQSIAQRLPACECVALAYAQ
jgi:hypothetical protein